MLFFSFKCFVSILKVYRKDLGLLDFDQDFEATTFAADLVVMMMILH